MAAIGWYGPLIDLSKASSHIGEYVQLLVFVHNSTPVQYNLLRGGEMIRTDIQVGDDTRRFFSLSIWHKHMGSTIVAGSVSLLQNVKVTKYGDIVEARSMICSSVQCLVNSHKMLLHKDASTEKFRVSTAAEKKFRRVVEWLQRAEPTIRDVGFQSNKNKVFPSINWKVGEETPSEHCFSLSDVLLMTDSCRATFSASVGEIFLPITWKNVNESEVDRMFLKRRLCTLGDSFLVEDLICSGCQHCGAPLNSEIGFNIAQGTEPLYCRKSSNHHHTRSLIYRPFMLYVWDDFQHIPLLVTNNQAKQLFGNISAESVNSSFRMDYKEIQEENQSASRAICNSDAWGKSRSFHPSIAGKSPAKQQKLHREPTQKTYLIWLILLRTMLQQGKNSPLKFQVRVDAAKDLEGGRFELLSMSMPMLGRGTSVSS